MSHVPSAPIQDLYNNTESEVPASPTIMDAAISAIVETINGNSDYTEGLLSVGTLSKYGYYSATSFGAKADGVTDDTVNIAKVLEYVANNGGTLLFPPGDYLLSAQGTYTFSFSGGTKSYALFVEGKSNFNIVFDPAAKLIVPMGDTDKTSAIVLKGCNNVQIINARAEGVGTATTKDLYAGALIVLDECDNVQVIKPQSIDLRHNTICSRSSNVKISKGFAIRTTITNQTGSFFGIYSCENTDVAKCTTYGGCNDGDIGLYGGGNRHNRIYKNRCHEFAYGDINKVIVQNGLQGIYVDAGAVDTKVSENYVYGCFYGVDIKTNTEGTMVSGNTAEKCRVGFAARRGEANAPTHLTTFINNIVIPDGGNGETTAIAGITVPIAFFLQDAFASSVLSNQVFNRSAINSVSDFIAVVGVYSGTISDGTKNGVLVSGNKISLENRVAGGGVGSSNERVFVFKGYDDTQNGRFIDLTITGNNIDPPFGASSEAAIELQYVEGVNISNNSFGEKRGDFSIKLTNCRGVNINGNSWRMHTGLVSATDCKGINFTGNNSFESVFGSSRSTLLLHNSTFVNVGTNVYQRYTAALADSFYVEATGSSDWISIVGNTLEIANKNSSNYYNIVGTNTLVDNNLVS